MADSVKSLPEVKIDNMQYTQYMQFLLGCRLLTVSTLRGAQRPRSTGTPSWDISVLPLWVPLSVSCDSVVFLCASGSWWALHCSLPVWLVFWVESGSCITKLQATSTKLLQHLALCWSF